MGCLYTAKQRHLSMTHLRPCECQDILLFDLYYCDNVAAEQAELGTAPSRSELDSLVSPCRSLQFLQGLQLGQSESTKLSSLVSPLDSLVSPSRLDQKVGCAAAPYPRPSRGRHQYYTR